MPSLAEGLSLPILEAWSHGLVAIGSESSVAAELIDTPQALFDPLNKGSLTATLERFLVDDARWLGAQQTALQNLKKFTWSETAIKALNALNEVNK